VKAWQEHSPKSLRQFVDPAPGRPRAPEEEFEGDPPNQEEGPVDTFCLVTLDPKEVELLLFQDFFSFPSYVIGSDLSEPTKGQPD
jgi:hypothetical protein